MSISFSYCSLLVIANNNGHMCPVYICLSGFRNYILNDRVNIVLEHKNIGMKLPDLKCHTVFLYHKKDSEIVGFL